MKSSHQRVVDWKSRGKKIFKLRQASLQFSENSVQVTLPVPPITGVHTFCSFVGWCLIVEVGQFILEDKLDSSGKKSL